MAITPNGWLSSKSFDQTSCRTFYCRSQTTGNSNGGRWNMFLRDALVWLLVWWISEELARSCCSQIIWRLRFALWQWVKFQEIANLLRVAVASRIRACASEWEFVRERV